MNCKEIANTMLAISLIFNLLLYKQMITRWFAIFIEANKIIAACKVVNLDHCFASNITRSHFLPKHIFSPLLKWRGGKGLATILGVWIGLSLWEVPLVILLALVIFKRLIRGDAWVIIFTEMFGLAYVLARQFSWVWATIFLFQLGLTFWTHRHEFGSAPRWRASAPSSVWARRGRRRRAMPLHR